MLAEFLDRYWRSVLVYLQSVSEQPSKRGCTMSRALVLGPGGLCGAYGGGVVATLGRKLGCNYFNAIYACSAGAYTGSCLLSGQPDLAEMIWRRCVHGRLLMRWHNIFRGRPILDLAYLNSVLQSQEYKFLVEDALRSSIKMYMVATDYQTGAARYFSPKTAEEFFLQVRASAAAPWLHPRVLISGREYLDGELSDPFPIGKALADGHDEILVVCNKSRQLATNLLKATNKNRVRAIFPSAKSPMRWTFDSSEIRINQLVDLGISDTLAFLA